jgi:type II secretory pathway pseudopilin PulG
MAQRFFTPQQLQHWAKEEPSRLLAAALTQLGQLQQRAQQLKEARARVVELESLLESAQQASLRQAAPFRVAQQQRCAAPKRPGRKAGHPRSLPGPARAVRRGDHHRSERLSAMRRPALD